MEVGNLTVNLGLNAKSFKAELSKTTGDLNREMKMVKAQFGAAAAGIDETTDRTKMLHVQSQSLNRQLEVQRKIVKTLGEAHELVAKEMGNEAVETQRLALKLAQAQEVEAKLAKQIRQTSHELQGHGAAIQKVSSHMHGMGQQTQGLIGKFTDMHTQMNLMFGGMAMSTVFTAPFVGMAKSAFKASVDFEEAFSGVRKTVDDTEENLKRLEKNFRELSLATPTSAEQLAKIGEMAGQLGIRGVANITKFTEVISKLAVSTNLSAEQGSTELARFANIMQMPIDNIDRLGATVVDLGNNLATTEAELVEFGLRIAGAGKQVGLSEAQVLALGGALSSVGIEAEAGGTAISRVLISLANASVKGGKDLNAFAKVAGMTGAQFKKAFQTDAAGATVAFIQGLRRIKDTGGNVFGVLDQLGLDEIRVRDALLRTSGAGDLLAKSLDLATNAWKENNALNEEAAKKFATTASQIQIMKNNAAELGRVFGETMGPYINKVIKSTTELLKKFQTLSPATQKLIVGFGAVAAALGPVMLGLSGFGAAITGLRTLFPVFAGGMAQAAVTTGTAAVSMEAGKVAALGLASGLGGVGIALGGLAGLGAGYLYFNQKATDRQRENAAMARELAKEYYELKAKTSPTVAEQQRMQEILNQISQLMPEVVTRYNDYGNAMEISSQKLVESIEAQEKQLSTWEKLKKWSKDNLPGTDQGWGTLSVEGSYQAVVPKSYDEATRVVQQNLETLRKQMETADQDWKAKHFKSAEEYKAYLAKSIKEYLELQKQYDQKASQEYYDSRAKEKLAEEQHKEILKLQYQDRMDSLSKIMSSGFENQAGLAEKSLTRLSEKISRGGEKIGQSWAIGLEKGMSSAEWRITGRLERLERMLHGNSPPKEGPLSKIDIGGRNIAMAWVQGFEQALGAAKDVGIRLSASVWESLSKSGNVAGGSQGATRQNPISVPQNDRPIVLYNILDSKVISRVLVNQTDSRGRLAGVN